MDLGLFGRIDAALLDEVFERTDSTTRVDRMSWLFGLLDPLRGTGPSVWRLHPLVRDLCAKLRRRDSPERYRSVNRRIDQGFRQVWRQLEDVGEHVDRHRDQIVARVRACASGDCESNPDDRQESADTEED